MTEARIFRPAKTAMQSGRAKTRQWLLEFEPASAREVEPLMGWTSSADTRAQVRLRFDSRDDAIAYAERNNIPYHVEEPREPRNQPKNYAAKLRPPVPLW